MTILIIAPKQADLTHLDDEIAALERLFYRPLRTPKPVTEDAIQYALETHAGDIEGVWFAGHASPDGWQLADGLLTPQAMAQYLSAAQPAWTYFNSCESAATVDIIQAAYQHDIYASIAPITDKTAWRTALLVAQNYADNGNIYQSFHSAAPPGTTPLRYFPSSRAIPMRNDTERLGNEMHDLTKAIYELRSEIVLLKHRVEKLEKTLDTPRPLLQEHQINRVVVALVFIAMLLLIGLYMLANGGGSA